MKDRFDFRVWDPADEAIVDQFVDVIKEAFGVGAMDAAKRKERFIWQHKGNPVQPPIVTYAVDRESNSVVAVRPMWLGGLMYGGRYHLTCQAVDASTRPAYQRLGLLKELTKLAIQATADRGGVFMFAVPNHLHSSYRGYLGIGARDFCRLSVLVKPMRGFIRMPYLYLRKREELKEFRQDSEKLSYKRITLSDFRGDLGIMLELRRRWGNVWLGDRDLRYYEWRVVQNPMCTYEAVNSDDCCAFIRRGFRSELREVRLSEVLFGVEDSRMKRALGAMCRQLDRTYRPDIITISLTEGHPYYGLFASCGFFRAPGRARLVNYPLEPCPKGSEDAPWALSGLDSDIE